jgi:signal transduction histidine kinase
MAPIAPGFGQTQQQLDSLEKLIPKKQGAEKIRLLNDLTFYYYQSNPKKAIAFGATSLKLAKLTNDPVLLANTYNDYSIPFLTTGDFNQALTLNQKALSIRLHLKDTVGMIASYSKIGNAYYELTNYDKAQFAYNKAIDLAKKIKQEGVLLQLYQNTANVLEQSGYVEEALKMQLDVNKIALKTKDSKLLLTNYGNIGSCYTKLNNYSKAREMYSKALALLDSKNHPEQLAMIYQGLGVTERAAGNLDLGIAHYKKALKIYHSIHSETGEGIVAVNIGNAFLDLKKYDSAEVYYQHGLNLVKNTQSFRQTLLAYRGLSNLEMARKNYQEAALYMKEQINFQDSVQLHQGNEILSEMFTKYEIEKKERALSEAETAKTKAQLQTTIWTSIAVGALIVLVFISILVVQRIKRNKESINRLKQEEQLLRDQQLTDQKLSISRELHDNIGSQITYMISSIDNLTYLNEDNVVLNEKLEDLGNFGRSTMTELRSTIWALNKEDGTIADLIQKIEALRTHVPMPIEIENHVNLNQALKSIELLNLYRIIQESIQNTIKYAKANYIHIQLKAMNDTLVLKIRDNGSGFDAKQPLGNGIQNMRYRCEQIQGTFQVTSSEEKGTEICCSIRNLTY